MNSKKTSEKSALKKANLLFKEGSYKEAIQAYREAIKFSPEFSKYIACNIEIAEKRLKKDKNQVTKAVENSPYIADIIIPHHDRADLLAECIKTIDRSRFNVIISSGGTFAENCNRGAESAVTENLIFLNDDTVIDDQLFHDVANSKTEVTGVAQKFPDRPTIIYGLGIRLKEDGSSERYFARTPTDICIPSGYFFGIKRSAWKKIGGFDEHFINGGEDADLFMRCIEAEMSFSFIEKPGLHFHSQSTGRNDRDDYNRLLVNYLWPRDRIKTLIQKNSERLQLTDEKKLIWSQGNDGASVQFPEIENAVCPYCKAKIATSEHFESCEQKAPLVSIVIPCREGETVLSLDSINRQTYKKLQVIVEYDKNKDGASAVRNRGAQNATGDYIFFCDNDVILNPNCISDLVNVLEKNKEAAWAFGKFYLDGKLRNQNKASNIPKIRTVDWVDYFTGVSTMSLVRASVKPRFDPEMKRYNDWDLWLTLHKNGFNPVFCNEILFVTLNKKGGISSGGNSDRIFWTNRLYSKHEVFVFAEIQKKNEEIKKLKGETGR